MRMLGPGDTPRPEKTVEAAEHLRMSPTSESLRTLASAGVRHWLRSVVDALLCEPGGLYNPVFVGPLSEIEALSEAVTAVAESRSMDLAYGAEPPAAGIWLASAQCAEEALAAGLAPRPGVQWLVWATGAVSTLPDRLAGWVGAKGLSVDPLAGAAESTAAWSMAPTVAAARAAGAARGLRAFVVVRGEASDLAELGAELQLSLELEFGRTVWRGRAEGWTEGDVTTEPRVLLVTAESDAGAICRRLGELGPGAPWGVVVDCEVADRMRSLAEWNVLDGRAWWLSRCLGKAFPGESSFPPIADLLIGTSAVSRQRDEIMQFTLGAVSLAEILQAAEGWARPGALIVFEADRVGWIRVGHGRVSGVGLVGGGVAEPSAEEAVYDLLATMAAWGGASVIFVPGASAELGVPIGRAVMAMAHAVAEGRGATALSAALRVHEVAQVLVDWGVPDVARGFLQRAEQALAWGPEEDVLLGNLSAARNPDAAAARLRHGAMRAFSEPRASGVDLYFDAMLNALLVEVRAGQTAPSVAWAIVGGWLRDAGTGWATTARHAAIWLELALRAGATDSARLAQDRLRAVAPARAEYLALRELPIIAQGGTDGR